jgi:hypothetical protein
MTNTNKRVHKSTTVCWCLFSALPSSAIKFTEVVQGDSEFKYNTEEDCLGEHVEQKCHRRRFQGRRFYVDFALIIIIVDFYKIETIRFNITRHIISLFAKRKES